MSKKNEKKFVKAKEELMEYTVEEREKVAQEIAGVEEESMENLVSLEKETIEELFFGEGRPVRAAFDLLVAGRKKPEGVESIFEPKLKNALEYVEGIGYVAGKKRSAYRYLILGLKAIGKRMSELSDSDDLSLDEAYVIYSAADMLITSVNDKLEEVKNKQYTPDEVLLPEIAIERGVKLNRLEAKLENGEIDADERLGIMVNAFKELADEIISEEENETPEEDADNDVVDVPVHESRTDDKILMRIVFGENTDTEDGSHYSNVFNALADTVNGGFKKVLNVKDSSMSVIFNNLVRYFKNYSNDLDKDNKDADKLIVEKYKALLHDVFGDADFKKLINDTLASYDKLENKTEAYNDRFSHYERAVVTSVYLAINTYVLVRLAKRDADRHIKGLPYSTDKVFEDIAFRVNRINNALLARFNLLTDWEYKNINNTSIEDGLDKALTVSLVQTYLYTVLSRLIRDDEIKDEDVAYLGTVLMLEFYLDRGAKTDFIVDELRANLENTPLTEIVKTIEEKASMSAHLVGHVPVILNNLVSKEYVESLLSKVDLTFRRVDDENDKIDPKVIEEVKEDLLDSNPLTKKGIPVNERLKLVEEKYLLNDGTRDIFYHALVRVTKEYYEKNKEYFITVGDNGVEELNIIKSLEGDVLKGITLVRLPIVTKNSLKNEDTGEEMVELGVLVQSTVLDRFMRTKFFASNDPVEWSISFMGDYSINYYRALAEHVIIDDTNNPYVLNAKLVKFYDENENLGSVELYSGIDSETVGTRLILHNDAFFLGTEEEFERDYNIFIEPIPKEIIERMKEDSDGIKNSENSINITDDFGNKDSAELLDAIKNKLLSLVDDSDKSSDSDTNDDDDENNGGKVN